VIARLKTLIWISRFALVAGCSKRLRGEARESTARGKEQRANY
jgi:hypothetical protein